MSESEVRNLVTLLKALVVETHCSRTKRHAKGLLHALLGL